MQTDRNVEMISSALAKDNRLTLRELAAKTRLTFYTVFVIIKTILQLTLKCAKWVPKILTKEQKAKRKNSASENIFLHNLDPEFFETHIVTGDETWVHHYTPETKRQSKQWLPKWFPRPHKAIRKLSAKKVLATIFWDSKGVLLVDFVHKGTTITGEYYANLLRKLLQKIRYKRPGMEEEGIFLLHDNASPHTSNVSQAAISNLGFIQLSHPAYSPDMAPSDYYLFPKLKKFLAKNPSTSDDEVEKTTKRYLAQKLPDFYARGIADLRHRWNRCVELRGAYVEN